MTKDMIVLDVVHASNGLLCIGFVHITDEPKASAATSVPIFNDNLVQVLLVMVILVLARQKYRWFLVTYSFFYWAKLLELLSEGGIVGMPGEATNKTKCKLVGGVGKINLIVTYPINSLLDIVTERQVY